MKTKEQMIDSIVESMETWDNDELLIWAQGFRRETLEGSTLKEVMFEYDNSSHSDEEDEDNNEDNYESVEE